MVHPNARPIVVSLLTEATNPTGSGLERMRSSLDRLARWPGFPPNLYDGLEEVCFLALDHLRGYPEATDSLVRQTDALYEATDALYDA